MRKGGGNRPLFQIELVVNMDCRYRCTLNISGYRVLNKKFKQFQKLVALKTVDKNKSNSDHISCTFCDFKRSLSSIGMYIER